MLKNKSQNLPIKKSFNDLFKISFFIGFLPSFIALIFDLKKINFDVSHMNGNTPLPSLNEMMGVLLPNSKLYISILSIYALISFIMILYLKVNKNRDKRIYLVTFHVYKFILPISETLFQLLSVIAGFFVTLAIVACFITSFSTISYLIMGIYTFGLAFVVIAAKNTFTDKLENQ